MKISMIAAVSNNNVIGSNNDLPFGRKKADFEHFKKITNNKIIIMGRKTSESIGKPLPNRTTIVISRTIEQKEGYFVGKTIEDTLIFAKTLINMHGQPNEVMIAGGSEIYSQFMPQANKLYMTKIDTNVEGDAEFPEMKEEEWEVSSTSDKFHPDSHNDFGYQFVEYERKV